jgi:hypothetical protein
MKYTCRILDGEPEWMIPLEMPREGDIEMNLKEMGVNICVGFIWLRTGCGGGLL